MSPQNSNLPSGTVIASYPNRHGVGISQQVKEVEKMLAIAMSHEKDCFPPSEQKILDIYEVFEKGSDESEPGAPTPFNVITALFDYMNTELALEEKTMPNNREMAKHKREHDNFRSTVMLYISMLQFGISPPAFEVRKFLESWINSHVVAPHAMLPG